MQPEPYLIMEWPQISLVAIHDFPDVDIGTSTNFIPQKSIGEFNGT